GVSRATIPGALMARVWYDDYGLPRVYAATDIDHNGVSDESDFAEFTARYRIGLGAQSSDEATRREAQRYRNQLDWDRDGIVGSNDLVAFHHDLDDPETAQRDVAAELGNLPLYGGYWWDAALNLYHVRHRVYDPRLGRWLQRDPLGYAAGSNLYSYVMNQPGRFVDPLGLRWAQAGGEPPGSGVATHPSEAAETVQCSQETQSKQQGIFKRALNAALWAAAEVVSTFTRGVVASGGEGSKDLSREVQASIAEKRQLALEMRRGGDVSADAAVALSESLIKFRESFTEIAQTAGMAFVFYPLGGDAIGNAIGGVKGIAGVSTKIAESLPKSRVADAMLMVVDSGAAGQKQQQVAIGWVFTKDRAGNAVTAATSYSSFKALKTGLPELPDGFVWHHIVEQCQANTGRARFSVSRINSVENIIAVPQQINQALANYYSGTDIMTGKQTVRDWLSKQPWDFQRNFGIEAVKRIMNISP
ncbi:MAG: RHS repeat-associated core domain-containing protein, partial [Planctomycetota bacterium]|nr:RHS repeat-associated core domain-containing protein [Planctomycetota bacterium]